MAVPLTPIVTSGTPIPSESVIFPDMAFSCEKAQNENSSRNRNVKCFGSMRFLFDKQALLRLVILKWFIIVVNRFK
jgi:hypothetical protein